MTSSYKSTITTKATKRKTTSAVADWSAAVLLDLYQRPLLEESVHRASKTLWARCMACKQEPCLPRRRRRGRGGGRKTHCKHCKLVEVQEGNK